MTAEHVVSSASSTPDAPECLISVVVCTKDRPESLARTVRSLVDTQGRDVEVIVIDQSVGAETADVLQPLAGANLRYVRSRRAGKGAALNEGIELARSAYIVCTDDDCVALPGWASGIVRPLIEHPDVALVFSNVNPAPFDSRLGYVPAREYKRDRLLTSAWGICRGWGLGAGMAMRRSDVIAIGGADESLGPGSRFPSADDLDLELRFLLKGRHVYETAQVGVTHYGFRTLEEGREHTVRDWSALGACLVKPLRAGHLIAVGLIAGVLWAYALYPALLDVLHLRKPKLRRVAAFTGGVVAGIAVPVERRTLKYMTQKSQVDDPTVANA
jgi:glycosyltransferase involved in cell wall biosynthesis